MHKKILVAFVLILMFMGVYGQTIPYSTGRIVISSDGNEHDHDDWAATPLSLALLASKGLQDSLTVYTFSDHIWGSNHDKKNGKAQMLTSALEGKKIFNFKNSNFIEAVEKPNDAVSAIAQQINQSHVNSPLTIIAAGPMEIVGRAIALAEPKKLKFVRLISHSNWNNNHADKPHDWEAHSGWTWAEIKEHLSRLALFAIGF